MPEHGEVFGEVFGLARLRSLLSAARLEEKNGCGFPAPHTVWSPREPCTAHRDVGKLRLAAADRLRSDFT